MLWKKQYIRLEIHYVLFSSLKLLTKSIIYYMIQETQGNTKESCLKIKFFLWCFLCSLSNLIQLPCAVFHTVTSHSIFMEIEWPLFIWNVNLGLNALISRLMHIQRVHRKSWTLDNGLWTLDSGCRTLHSRRWIMDTGHCTANS